MKMMTIICREQFEDDVFVLFSTLGIKGYTVIPGAGGSGETGVVSATYLWANRNRLLLIALDDDQMAILVHAVKELHARLVEAHAGHEVPFKVFLQPCELIL